VRQQTREGEEHDEEGEQHPEDLPLHLGPTVASALVVVPAGGEWAAYESASILIASRAPLLDLASFLFAFMQLLELRCLSMLLFAYAAESESRVPVKGPSVLPGV
jgi:hypothetical protein